MLLHIPDAVIDRFIQEDAPYGDLTTHLLGIGPKHGKIIYWAREESVLCCSEEASRLLNKLGAATTRMLPSGTLIPAGSEFLEAEGTAAVLHSGWKAALNLLEYASGIANRTARIIKTARSVNPDISVVTTRKSFPGTKQIVMKAIMAGGALPHRLGLSETILVFKQHMDFMGGLEEFLKAVPDLRARAKESKVIVEADTSDEAVQIARAGVDVVQLDKANPDELKVLVKELRNINPLIKISAAGGINETNIERYAATGVDIIVLSSVYFGKPSDMSVKILPL